MKTELTRWTLYAGLLLKRQMRGPKVYILSALCIFLLYVFQNVVFPVSYRMEYGVFVDGAVCGEEIIERLKKDDLYHVLVFDSRKAMEDEVRAGRIDCGFVLDSRLNGVKSLRNLRKLAEYVTSPSTAKGVVLREKVFAAFLASAAGQMLVSFTENGEIFETESDALKQDMERTYRYIHENTEVIEAIFETVDISASEKKENAASAAENERRSSEAAVEFALSDVSLLDKFLGLCGIMIFSAAIIFARSRFSSECRRMVAAMRGADRTAWPVLNIITQVLPVSIAIIAAYIAGMHIYGCLTPALAVKSFVVFLLFGIFCSVWAYLYSLLFRKEAMYLGCIVGIIVLSLLTCKPFFRVGMFIPVVEAMKWLFPVNYLLMI